MQRCGDDLLQGELDVGMGNGEEDDFLVAGRGVQDAIEDGLDEQQSEGVQQTNGGHEQHGEHGLQTVGSNVAKKPQQSLHCGLPVSLRCWLQGGAGIRMSTLDIVLLTRLTL